MRITILMKQVPDTDEVKMDPERGTMIRDGAGGIVNPLDLNALEAAMQIRRHGDTISILSMGPLKAEESLREGLALGADTATLVTDKAFAGADTWATSKVLVAAMQKTGLPDLILAGEKATDGETGQVGPEVAALLRLPIATHVTRLSLCENEIEVDCTLEDGVLTQRLPVPCVATLLSGVNLLPLPTLAGKKRAYAQSIETISANDLGMSSLETGLDISPTRVVSITHPKLARQTEKYFAKRAQELEAGLDRVVKILVDATAI